MEGEELVVACAAKPKVGDVESASITDMRHFGFGNALPKTEIDLINGAFLSASRLSFLNGAAAVIVL